MKRALTFLTILFAAALNACPAQADDNVTAVIDIDNRPLAIQVADLPSCVQAIQSRINGLKNLYQDNFTVTDVIAACYARDGRLLASGRCGVKLAGQAMRLCIPEIK
jgi:hypothetical protein